MARFRLIPALSVVVVGALLTGAPVAHAAPPDSAPAAAPVIPPGLVVASGVASDNGRPLAGAEVVALAWPRADVLAALPDGAGFATVPLGTATADASGVFRVKGDSAALTKDYVDDKGRVDVELVAVSEDREMRWNFTAASSRAANGGARWALARDRGRGANLVMDFGAGVAFDSSDDPAEWVLEDGSRVGEARRAEVAAVAVERRSPQADRLMAAAGDVQTMEICTGYTGTTHYNRPERFAQVYAWQGAYATLTETSGTDHTLGIGYQSNSGSWSSSGSSTLSFSASASRGQLADTNVYNAVNYRDYHNTCWTGKYRKPVGYYALLTSFTWAPHVNYGSCTRYTGGTYTKTQGRNTTFATGVNIGGFSVSAQSGWTSETKVSWTVTSASYLCGNTSYGWVSSPMAEAHKG